MLSLLISLILVIGMSIVVEPVESLSLFTKRKSNFESDVKTIRHHFPRLYFARRKTLCKSARVKDCKGRVSRVSKNYEVTLRIVYSFFFGVNGVIDITRGGGVA